jgi:hypothetical protein
MEGKVGGIALLFSVVARDSLLVAPWLSRSVEGCDVSPEGLGDDEREPGRKRFAPNMILPRLENSNCSNRSSSTRRLSVGMSVVIGIKTASD